MTATAVGNVLGILRLLRSGDYGSAVLNHVGNWCGGPIDPIKIAKVCGYVLENVAAAESQIKLSNLNDEAKQGLLQTTAAINTAFLFGNLNSSVQQFFPALDASISNFAILVSASGFSGTSGQKEEIDTLVLEIEATYASLDKIGLHPLVAETARRHLAVLITLLKNADALGVDAALAAYFELMVHLKRAEQAKPQSGQKSDGDFWEKLKNWGSRLKIISDIADKSESLLNRADSVVPLLEDLMG